MVYHRRELNTYEKTNKNNIMAIPKICGGSSRLFPIDQKNKATKEQ